MKYKDIIREFEIFANVHPDVAKFKSDTVDRLDNFSNENEVFPMLYVSPISNVPIIYPSEYSATIFSFRAFVLVPRIDLEEIALDNDINLNQTNTNLEQCQLIINHFKTHLNKIIEELSFGAQPLNEFGIDRLQGWSLDFDIEVPTSDCEEDWIPTDFCPPGVAKNTSGSFSVVVQADSTEIIPDITVTDSDGTTRTQPSVTDVFCKLSEDSTITLNNAPFITVPSGATENIQLVKEDLTPFSDYTVVGNVVTVGDCPIVPCAPSEINVNGSFFLNVPSGQAQNILVKDNLGNQLSVFLSGNTITVFCGGSGSQLLFEGGLFENGLFE